MRRLTILLLFFAIAIAMSGQQKTIVINEIMADNASTIADESGKFEDWIEIYNYGEKAVDLAGCYITDNYLEPKLFRLRQGNDSTIIQPKSYLLLWADDEWEEGICHLEFKLSRKGEQVAIFDTDGETIIDSVSFPAQLPNYSWGRKSDNHSQWRNFDSPTPGASND